MTPNDIANKYVHGLHDALTDAQEKQDMVTDILNFAKAHHKNELTKTNNNHEQNSSNNGE